MLSHNKRGKYLPSGILYCVKNDTRNIVYNYVTLLK